MGRLKDLVTEFHAVNDAGHNDAVLFEGVLVEYAGDAVAGVIARHLFAARLFQFDAHVGPFSVSNVVGRLNGKRNVPVDAAQSNAPLALDLDVFKRRHGVFETDQLVFVHVV